jgi:hypothetical protein
MKGLKTSDRRMKSSSFVQQKKKSGDNGEFADSSQRDELY